MRGSREVKPGLGNWWVVVPFIRIKNVGKWVNLWWWWWWEIGKNVEFWRCWLGAYENMWLGRHLGEKRGMYICPRLRPCIEQWCSSFSKCWNHLAGCNIRLGHTPRFQSRRAEWGRLRCLHFHHVPRWSAGARLEPCLPWEPLLKSEAEMEGEEEGMGCGQGQSWRHWGVRMGCFVLFYGT